MKCGWLYKWTDTDNLALCIHFMHFVQRIHKNGNKNVLRYPQGKH